MFSFWKSKISKRLERENMETEHETRSVSSKLKQSDVGWIDLRDVVREAEYPEETNPYALCSL